MAKKIAKIEDVSKRELKNETKEQIKSLDILNDILDDNKIEVDLSIGKVTVTFRWEFDSKLNSDRARLDSIHLDDLNITNNIGFFDLIKVYSIIRIIKRKLNNEIKDLK